MEFRAVSRRAGEQVERIVASLRSVPVAGWGLHGVRRVVQPLFFRELGRGPARNPG